MGLVPETGRITPLLVLHPAFLAAWQKPLDLLLPSCPSPNLPLHLHALNPLSFGPGSQPITLTQATVTLATVAFAAAVGVGLYTVLNPRSFTSICLQVQLLFFSLQMPLQVMHLIFCTTQKMIICPPFVLVCNH